jgi:hypothetical protein
MNFYKYKSYKINNFYFMMLKIEIRYFLEDYFHLFLKLFNLHHLIVHIDFLFWIYIFFQF